jgi:hypothetical protein
MYNDELIFKSKNKTKTTRKIIKKEVSMITSPLSQTLLSEIS